MISWLIRTLPSAMFEFFFYTGLVGIVLLAADRKERITCKANRFLLLSAFAYAFLLRFFAGRGSSRYSNLLIPLFLLFSSIFFMRLLELIPQRFRKSFAIVGFALIFLGCTAKIVRQYDGDRIRLFRTIAGCVGPEQGRVRLAGSEHEGSRLAWYAGIPEFVPIYQRGNAPETRSLLFPLKNRDGVFYVVLQNMLSSRPVTAKELDLPEHAWQLRGEFVKDRHKKYVLRVYRYQPEPHWRKVADVPPEQTGVAPVFRDDFERPDGPAKAETPEITFPSGWGGFGARKDDVRVLLEKTKPIKGSGSLSVRATIFAFLPTRYFPADGDYTLRFLVRGQKNTSLLARVYVYPWQGKGYAVDLDKFFFEDGELHECQIPVSFRNMPDAKTFRISFVLYNGEVMLDDFQLIPAAPRSEPSRGARNPSALEN